MYGYYMSNNVVEQLNEDDIEGIQALYGMFTHISCWYIKHKTDFNNFISYFTGARNNDIPNNFLRPNTISTTQPVSVRSYPALEKLSSLKMRCYCEFALLH